MTVDRRKWRIGRPTDCGIFAQVGPDPSDDDRMVGTMGTPELARDAVDAHNWHVALMGDVPARFDPTDGITVHEGGRHVISLAVGRHYPRPDVADAVAGRLLAGEDPEVLAVDFGVTVEAVWVAAASMLSRMLDRRPDRHRERIGHLDDGDLDEVVAEHAPMVHLESLGPRNAYLHFTRPDRSTLAVELYATAGRLRMTAEEIRP